MCSVDKCKPHYYATKEVDPDVTEDRINRKIWDNAVANGMDYLGFITGEERDDILSKSKFLIDSSWSVGYGEHFNRTLFEAMMLGVIPIAVNYGVSDNEEGNGTLLHAGVNYLMLRKDMTPKEYGDAVNDWMFNLTEDEARVIINNNLELLKKLDRKLIAKQFISLALGEDAGFYETNLIGNPAADPKAVKKAAEMWDEQFVAKQESSLEEFFG
jgi:glycosyltransferase involved in cell wall biosynthesis